VSVLIDINSVVFDVCSGASKAETHFLHMLAFQDA
jgi:hypothetical protein